MRELARIEGIQKVLKPGSFIATATLRDRLLQFDENPFQPLDSTGRLRAFAIAGFTTQQAHRWQHDFIARTIASWDAGGDMWISRRLLAWHPLPEWEWVEGDDPSVRWRDLASFFTALELGESVGGTDGFVRVLPSAHNRQVLTR
jgi:hypothetical protein